MAAITPISDTIGLLRCSNRKSRGRVSPHQLLAALFVLLALSFGSHARTDPTSVERQKIDYLIASIETLQGAAFIRNGIAYDARAAVDHLRLKLRSAGSRVETADDFIRICASASSISGKPYQIRFADGRIISAETFLREKLAEFPGEGISIRDGHVPLGDVHNFY